MGYEHTPPFFYQSSVIIAIQITGKQLQIFFTASKQGYLLKASLQRWSAAGKYFFQPFSWFKNALYALSSSFSISGGFSKVMQHNNAPQKWRLFNEEKY